MELLGNCCASEVLANTPATVTATMQRSATVELPLPPVHETTGATGIYEFPGLEVGDYDISVSHPDYTSPKPESKLLTDKQEEVNFTLRNRLTLTGRQSFRGPVAAVVHRWLNAA